jgi:very-short-patch-repair endonuclease
MINITKEEIQNIYDYSKSKSEIIKKLQIRTNQNGINIDKDILEYFSQIGINNREQISKKNLSKHWLEIQKCDYELNPKFCLNCGKKLPFEKRFSKCCNQSCANSYSNKKRGNHSFNTNEKIKSSIIKFRQNELEQSHKYKKISLLVNDGIILNKDNYNILNDKFINITKLHLKKCPICGIEFYGRLNKNGNYGKFKTCSSECEKKLRSINSKISVNNLIKNGKHKGWIKRNIISYAEKFWINVLDNNNIEYTKEYPLKRENSQSYFLDFYIELNNRKIDLEIDGKQHLFEDRKEHDKIRDEYIKAKGIEVYRIPWNEINSENGKQLMKEKINNFLKYINMGVV